MANKPLDQAAIASLLSGPRKSVVSRPSPYPHPPQNGPLHWCEDKSHCTSRGCRVETYIKVSGIYYCSSHALVELNKLLTKLGVDAKICEGCGMYWHNPHIGTTAGGDLDFDKEQMAYVCKSCGGVIVKREAAA